MTGAQLQALAMTQPHGSYLRVMTLTAAVVIEASDALPRPLLTDAEPALEVV